MEEAWACMVERKGAGGKSGDSGKKDGGKGDKKGKKGDGKGKHGRRGDRKGGVNAVGESQQSGAEESQQQPPRSPE